MLARQPGPTVSPRRARGEFSGMPPPTANAQCSQPQAIKQQHNTHNDKHKHANLLHTICTQGGPASPFTHAVALASEMQRLDACWFCVKANCLHVIPLLPLSGHQHSIHAVIQSANHKTITKQAASTRYIQLYIYQSALRKQTTISQPQNNGRQQWHPYFVHRPTSTTGGACMLQAMPYGRGHRALNTQL